MFYPVGDAAGCTAVSDTFKAGSVRCGPLHHQHPKQHADEWITVFDGETVAYSRPANGGSYNTNSDRVGFVIGNRLYVCGKMSDKEERCCFCRRTWDEYREYAEGLKEGFLNGPPYSAYA